MKVRKLLLMWRHYRTVPVNTVIEIFDQCTNTRDSRVRVSVWVVNLIKAYEIINYLIMKMNRKMSMSPLIDCVFLLLIFFLVSTMTKVKNRDISVDLPTSESAIKTETG